MSKKLGDDERRNARATKIGRAPPPLSDKLIAKLQEAVEAAQRNRLPRSKMPADVRGGGSGEMDEPL